MRKTGQHEVVAGTPYYDPEEYVLRQEAGDTMLTLLARLSQDEQDAIVAIYGLEALLDRDPPDEAYLTTVFNTSDLSQYVEKVILPKLRDAG